MCTHFCASKWPMQLYKHKSASAELFPHVNSEALVPPPGVGVGTTNGVSGTQGSYFKLGWLKVFIKLASEYVFPQTSLHLLGGKPNKN